MIGIDRVLLSDLRIEQINKEVLQMNGFTVIENEESCRIFKDDTTGGNISVSYIKVSKKQEDMLLINELRVGRLDLGNGFIDYEHLDATLPKAISSKRTNEDNISSLAELLAALGVIAAELEVLGFGKIELTDTKLKKIELNCNIPLERPFKEYKEVLSYLMNLLPGRMKYKEDTYKRNEVFTGLKAGNGSTVLKMYDKRADIKAKYQRDLGEERLRIEYSLLNEQKIASIFGSNDLIGIIKDFGKVERAYKDLIYNDIIKRVYKDIDRQQKQAIRTIKGYRKKNKKGTVDKYLKNYQTELLDIGIVLAALREVERSNNYARACKRVLKSAKEIEGRKLFGNIKKLNEILKALGYKTINLDITPGIEKEYKHTKGTINIHTL